MQTWITLILQITACIWHAQLMWLRVPSQAGVAVTKARTNLWWLEWRLRSGCLHMQGVLGSAFLVEGILFAFHLKGSSLDKLVHILLVLLVFAAALVCFAEIG